MIAIFNGENASSFFELKAFAEIFEGFIERVCEGAWVENWKFKSASI